MSHDILDMQVSVNQTQTLTLGRICLTVWPSKGCQEPK